MKKMIIAAAVLCAALLFPGTALAAANNFVITSYDVNIQVNENNTYAITENITADFPDSSHHGIRRLIPQIDELTREVPNDQGGTYVDTKKYHISVSNVQSRSPFSVETSDGYYDIRLGDPDAFVSGKQQYTLSYVYDMGEDGYSAFDDMYFNIIGDEWLVPIEGVTFTVAMPKAFDSKPGFSIGSYLSSGYFTEDLQYSVDGSVITGKVNRMLYPGEAVTMRLVLPDGYYVGATQNAGPALPLMICTLAVFGLAILLAMLFIRRKKPVETLEFYPPEGMTPADVGCVIDGVVEDKDVVSLIIYWADKGYIAIIREKGSKNLTFRKIKDLPEDANAYERTMFDSMFESGDTTSVSKLQYKFYNTIAAAKEMVRNKYSRKENLAFVKRSVSLQSFAGFLAALPPAFMAGFNIYEATLEPIAAVIISLIVMGVGFALVSVYIRAIETWYSAKRTTRTGHLIGWAIGTALLYFIVIALSVDLLGMFAFLPPLAGLIITFLAPRFRVWTDRGVEWAGRILGLKNFIETVESEKLKMMVEENPSYFYNVLPYAYVLGITDKWSKQFEQLAVEPPSWYYGYHYNTFSTVLFTSLLVNNMMYTQAAMVSRPNTGSGGFGGGGGFSGGGFSGGGGGGGGGGGW